MIDKKIIAYLGRTPDFLEEVKLQDDGDGVVYIKEWNATDKPKPTDAQLDALSSQAETLEKNAIAVANRQKEYGSIASQIEFITEKGLEAWKTNVQSIKTKYSYDGLYMASSDGSNADNIRAYPYVAHLDSPNTTGVCRYKFRIKAYSCTAKFNEASGRSRMYLFEVGA